MSELKIGSIQHKKSNVVNDVDGIKTPKLPESSRLVYGEIAINYAKDYETLSIKNSSEDVVTFSSDSIIYGNVDNKIAEVESGLTSAIAEVESGLTEETQTRTTEIERLEKLIGSIDVEEDEPSEGRDNLASLIRQESKSRKDADIELQTQIDAVESGLTEETQTRTSEIERLENLINGVEAGISDATEVKVSSGASHIKIESEITSGKVTYTISELDIASAAVLAEVKEDVDKFFKDASFTESAKDTLKELQDYINTDVEGAATMTKAIADNKTAIENEEARALSAESGLTAAIGNEEARAKAAESGLTATIDNEVNRAKAAESGLTATIESEVNRAKAAEKANADDIAAEEARALSAESGLTAAIGNEEARAKAAESGLTATIDNEVNRAKAAESGLTATIESEVNRAKAAEKANADDIAAEEARALSAESGLTAAIGNEEARAKAAESGLTTAIVELDNKKADVIDVTPLFEVGGTISGYTFEDLMTSKLWYNYSEAGDIGASVRYVGYGQNSAYYGSIAYLVIDGMIWSSNLRPHNSDAYAYVAEIKYGDGGITTAKVSDFDNSNVFIFDMDRYMTFQSNSNTASTKNMFDALSYAISKNKVIIVSEPTPDGTTYGVYERINGNGIIGLQNINGHYDTSNPTLTYTYYEIDTASYHCAKYTVDGNMTKIIDVKPLFEVGGTMNGYTLEDLMTNKLWYDYSNAGVIGNAVKYVGYGNAISSKYDEAHLVMESFEGVTRKIAIAHIKANGSTLTTDSVNTYSSNVFVMRVSQVDYETMKSAGTLDANTLYVIAEVTE